MPAATQVSRWGAVGALTLAIALALTLQVRDPHRPGSWGVCPWKLLTGWDCPGCGALRAVNDLGHGHLDAALHSNALLILSLPLVALAGVGWLRRSLRGTPLHVRPRVVAAGSAAYACIAVAFAVYRNTPWGAALWVP